MTGISLSSYISKRRLSQCVSLLRDGNSVTEIALLAGYETPEAFSKAFKRFHTITPREAGHKTAEVRWFPPLQLNISTYGDEMLSFRLENKPAFHLRGTSYQLSCDPAIYTPQIENIWNQLDTGNDKGNPVYVGATFFTHEDNYFRYAVCTFTENNIGETDQLWSIGSRLWAVFSCDTQEPSDISSLWKRVYSEWAISTNFAVIYDIHLEVYIDDHTEIWIPLESHSSLKNIPLN